MSKEYTRQTILSTSIAYAATTIKKCDDIELLTDCLKAEKAGRNRTTMVMLLNSRIRRLEKS